MKKRLCLILVGCLLITSLCLSGCGKESKQASSDDVMTIDWMPQNDDYVDEESPIVKKYEEILGVKFNFIYLDRSKMAELLNLRIASNQIPDVMRLSKDLYQTYMDQGVLLPFSEETLEENAPTLHGLVKQNAWDSVWDDLKKDELIYGIPTLNINGQFPLVPIWRDDWLKNVGIDKIPETLEEAEEAFRRFVNNDPDGNGKKDTYALSDKGFNAIFGAFGTQEYGAWLEDDNGKLVYSLTMPEMKEALTLLNRWYKEGLIDPEFITGESKGQYWANTVSFWNGRIGFSVPGMYYHISKDGETESVNQNYSNFKSLQGKDATYVPGVPIVGPDGKSGTQKWGTYSGNYVVMGKNVQKTDGKMEKILQIHEKINSDFDFFKLTVLGIEGEDYTVEGDVYDRSLFSNKGISTSAAGIDTNGIAYIQNNFEFRSAIAGKDMEYAEKVADFPGYVNKVWVGLPSSSQFASIVENKGKEAIILFITGQRSLDEFDEYVKEMNTAGLSQLTKEANEWYASLK